MSAKSISPFTSPDPRLARCRLCPRRCGVNRLAGPAGACATGAGLEVAAVVLHRGEEPVLGGTSGVCNVFFTGCNLHCVFCQNHQVSRGAAGAPRLLKPEQVLPEIRKLLHAGCDSLGLVSPSHVVPQVKDLLDSLASENLNPTVIHNGNAYDDPVVLAELAGKIDVYLPDIKYIDGDTAKRLSGVSDYPVRAFAALEEMVRQVGDGLAIDGGGVARRGLIVRHLVLPGLVDDSIDLLRKLADRLGTGVHLSLMAQYYPPAGLTCPPPLDRRLGRHEYETVAEEAMRLGFDCGWFQEPGSADFHNPDFMKNHPFST